MASSELYKACYRSPVGLLRIIGRRQGILSVDFAKGRSGKGVKNHPALRSCIFEMRGYFKGSRKRFRARYLFEGTPFQKKVWKELLRIPYGTVVSYKEIAVRIGNKKAVRAVGSALRKNKIPIMVPCHRVIASSGELSGYAGGLSRKRWLLKHESRSKLYYNNRFTKKSG